MPINLPQEGFGGAEFIVALEKFEADTALKMDIILRKIAFDIFTSVVAGIPVGVGTPVDTGRARGGWQVGIDEDPTGETGRLGIGKTVEARGASVATATIAAESPKILGASAESTVYIANNVEYISVLEGGSSRQAPFGMLGTAVAAFDYLTTKAATEADIEVSGGSGT